MSYILAYTGTPQPCCSIGHYASLIIYYSPDETVDAFLKRLPAFFLPKYKRLASQFGGKVETAISTFLNHCREVEKMVDEKEACEDEKKEEKKEEKPAAKPSIPVDSEGKPVRIDNNWKQFMAKHGGKKPSPKTSQKRKEAPKNNQPQAKERTLLDDSEEVHSSKKIPLTKKVPLRK